MTLDERVAMAANPETSYEHSLILAVDFVPDVRMALAKNTVHPGIFMLLFKDPDKKVGQALTDHIVDMSNRGMVKVDKDGNVVIIKEPAVKGKPGTPARTRA